MLKRSVTDQRLAVQLDSATVLLRELDGYGAYVEFRLPELHVSSTIGGPNEDADTIFWTAWRGGGGLNAFITASGGVLVIDIYPLDGVNYTTQECERILFGDPSDLRFHPFWPEPGKRLGL